MAEEAKWKREMGGALGKLAKAYKTKMRRSFEKMELYKNNWEAIQKMGLLALMKEKLRIKQKLAFKELFAQTRMFRPFSLVLKLHELFKRKQWNSKVSVFRKFNRGQLKKKEFGRHLVSLCHQLMESQKKKAFSEIDLQSFEQSFRPKGQLVNVLMEFERRKKKNILRIYAI